jgi:hypothetical protein
LSEGATNEIGGSEIAIPVKGAVLAKFISDLLGERRTTERVFRGYQFNIDLGWLTNLHRVIDQRIVAQNAGTSLTLRQANISILVESRIYLRGRRSMPIGIFQARFVSGLN